MTLKGWIADKLGVGEAEAEAGVGVVPDKWTLFKKMYADKNRYRKVGEYLHNPVNDEIYEDYGYGEYDIKAYNKGVYITRERVKVGTEDDILEAKEKQLEEAQGQGLFSKDLGEALDMFEEQAGKVAEAETQLKKIKTVFGGSDERRGDISGVWDGYNKGLGNAIYKGLDHKSDEVASSAIKLFDGAGELLVNVGKNFPQILRIIAKTVGADDIDWDTSKNKKQEQQSSEPDEPDVSKEELSKKADKVLDGVVDQIVEGMSANGDDADAVERDGEGTGE